MDAETIRNILIVVPVLLFSVIAHEYAHGYAALRQGDPTAFNLGRLTWNPVKHIDPFLTILLPAMLLIASKGQMALGAAKPVPVNPRRYRNYKRGDIIVSLAGVATNLVLAIACTLVVPLLGIAGRAVPSLTSAAAILQLMMFYGVSINLLLIAFNLIPIPPLDGSHVMKYLLPPSWSLRYQELGRYGFLVLILLLWMGGPILSWWLTPANTLGRAMLGSVGSYVLPAPWTQ